LWLVIDEMSMLTMPLLALLNRVAGLVRTGVDGIHPTVPFRGLNIILTGDLHQFPPVANRSNELYNALPKTTLAQLGCTLFEKFDIVVKLDQQMRIQDIFWDSLLQRFRSGDCSKTDIEEIRKLVLSHPECDTPDFTTSPWNNAILVTPHNSMRCLWNSDMLKIHCRRSGNIRFLLYVEDTSNNCPLTLPQHLAVAHLKLDQTKRLPHLVEFAIGMKTMVLENIAPHLALANGSHGVITGIILHPEESVTMNETGAVVLKHPPAVLLFK
ncbi:hypothetical protein EI94DRAFT_1543572, partial [Lactarius quietus]